MIGSQQVGHVAPLDVREGESVAHVQIEGKYRHQIPSASRFEVCSLNVWWPGRVGIRILPPSTPSLTELPDGAFVQTSNTMLPADIPPRFYLLIVLSVVGVVVLVLVGKALRSIAPTVSGVAIIVAIVAHLSGMVSLPS